MVVVAASAAGFGVALFGRRPVPQPAMSAPSGDPGRLVGTDAAEGVPSEPVAPPRRRAADLGGTAASSWLRRLVARDATVDHQPDTSVVLSRWERARSALLLGLTVVGLAAILGGVLSVVVVGLVLLLT